MTPLDRLRSHWPGLRAAGRGQLRGPCVLCEARTAASAREAADGRVLLHLHCGCSAADALAAVGLRLRDLFPDRLPSPMRSTPMPVPVPRQVGVHDDAQRRDRQALAARLWRESLPLANTPGELYLRGRGCPPPPADGDLRYLARVRVFGLDGPALVGRITLATDARVAIGAHLTGLAHDGERWRRTERRYVGGKAGGVVRLSPDECVTYALGVAEGCETALAVGLLARVPVWACLDAQNLEQLPVLPGIETLHVAVDRDQSGTGQRAAAALARRWQAAGREVVLLAADELGADLADETEGLCAA